MSRFVSEIVRSLAESVVIPFTAKPYGIRMKQIYAALKTNVLDDLRKQGLESSLGKTANQTWLLAFWDLFRCTNMVNEKMTQMNVALWDTSNNF